LQQDTFEHLFLIETKGKVLTFLRSVCEGSHKFFIKKINSIRHVAALNDTLRGIENKVQLLISKVAQLERENAALSEQVRTLTDVNRSLQTDLLLRDSEISHLKTHTQAQEDTDSDEKRRNHQLRKEIDQYIEDIDKCIAFLQKN
jgi:chromosome segregation ATPase